MSKCKQVFFIYHGSEYITFWSKRLTFPLGLYCESHELDWRFRETGYTLKDCGTCRFLRFGRCFLRKVPRLKKEIEAKEAKE